MVIIDSVKVVVIRVIVVKYKMKMIKFMKFIRIIKQQFSLIKKYSPGWMDGWIDGRKSRFKDCLQQSKNLLQLVVVVLRFVIIKSKGAMNQLAFGLLHHVIS